LAHRHHHHHHHCRIVDNRFNYLVTVVKNVVSSVESVSLEQNSASSGGATATLASRGATGGAKGQAAVTQATIRKIREAMAALDKAAFDADSRERTQSVNNNAKLTVQGLYRLMEQASERSETDDVGVELKRCAVQLVNATKGMMKNSLDPHHQQQFKQALRQIEEALQQFYLAVAQPTTSTNAADLDQLQRPTRAAPQLEAVYALPPPIANVATGAAPVVMLPPPPLPPMMEDITELTPPEPPSHADLPPPLRPLARTPTRPPASGVGVRASTTMISPGRMSNSPTLSPSAINRPRALSNAHQPSAAAAAAAAVAAATATASSATQPNKAAAAEFVGERKRVAAVVGDVIVVLRREVPELTTAWKAMSSDKRLAVLNQCVDAAVKRLEASEDGTSSDLAVQGTLKLSANNPLPLAPSPALPGDADNGQSLVRARSSTMIDDTQLRELSRMMGLQETSDYDQIRGAAAAMRKRIEHAPSQNAADMARHLASLDGDVAKRLGALSTQCDRSLTAVIEQVSKSFTDKRRPPALTEHIEATHQVLLKIAQATAEPFTYGGPLPGEEEAVTSKVFASVVAAAHDFQTQAPMLEYMVEAATADATAAGLVADALYERAWHARIELQAIAAQLVGALRLLDETTRFRIDAKLLPVSRHASVQDANCTQLALQVAASVRGVVGQLSELLGFTETFLYTTGELTESQEQQHAHLATMRSRSFDVVGEPLWGGNDDNDEGLGGDNNDMMSPATLNQLIRRLTSPSNYDTKFMQTFVTTYQSFCDPWTVLNKLIERYHVPASHKDQATTIRLRVCIVLKYWIEKQFFDLDVRTLERLRQFIATKLDGEMAKRLMGELERIETARGATGGLFAEMVRLNVPDFDRAPAKIFVQFASADIAQQMTLIESNMFRLVKPSELLSQAWNKPKLKYRAPHVLEMIARSNKVSRFVASTILWQRKRHARASMYGKWLQIADRLRRLNNFNTLMGVLAGLNMSSVNRLRHTISLLSAKHMELKAALQQLVAPTQSFKQYRDALHQVTGACVPYLGVYLTDLTFTEDGNKDTVQKPNDAKLKLINIKKRALVHNIISEVQLYQQASFDLTKIEPLFTMILEVPNVDESSLYAMSLLREPRGAEENQIE
jgi:hypothetical protein